MKTQLMTKWFKYLIDLCIDVIFYKALYIQEKTIFSIYSHYCLNTINIRHLVFLPISPGSSRSSTIHIIITAIITTSTTTTITL